MTEDPYIKSRFFNTIKPGLFLKVSRYNFYESLNINNSQIEHLQQYKYLGSIVNMCNSIEEEIKEVGLVMYKGCRIPEQLRRYLIGNP
jgi:hypothetical protein